MVDDWRVKAAADSLNVGRERLRSAELLAGAGQSRDAISRAYYAVLAAAHACLAANGIRAHSHAGTIRQFSLLFSRPVWCSASTDAPLHALKASGWMPTTR